MPLELLKSLNNILFKYFSRKVIIDIYPSRFLFTCLHNDMNYSVDTYIYLNNSGTKSMPISIGEEIPNDILAMPDTYHINVFELDNQLPPKTTYSRDDLIELLFEFGIGRCFETTIMPVLRPIVFILGADRFNDQFENPQEIFEKAAKQGGAGMVVFDKTEL